MGLAAATLAAVFFVSEAVGAAPAQPSPPPPAPTTAPAPHVIRTFAQEPKGARKAIPRGPRPPVRVSPEIDGCDRNYGDAGQCVPKALPPGQSDYCEYLRKHGFKEIRVKGPDTKRLDSNRNGVACD